MSPDDINAERGAPVYRCRPCRAETGLSWYRGTSCPVCSRPECIAALDAEWLQAYEDEANRSEL